MTKNHRNNDPPTSAQTRRQLELSGAAQKQRTRCLEEVIETPGQTAREIEDRIGVKAHKRLPELRQLGLVANGPERACRITRRRAMTWFPSKNAASSTGEYECH